MSFKALLTVFIFVAGLMVVSISDADAARFGGGKSFGSKPSMSKSAPAPMMQQKAPAAGVAGAAGAAAKPGLLGGMGGMMGGLLAGTLLGSLLFGGGMGGGGGGFMDIIIIGLLLFVAFKLYSRFKASRTMTGATAGGPSMGRMQAPEEPMAREAENRGGMNWGNLQGQGAQEAASPEVNVPAGFDSEEFLRGAKMAYTRLQAAWDKRDVADIANFARPAVLAEVQKMIEAEPVPSKTEILLVNAQLLEVKDEGAEQNAMVFFDVLLREDPAQTTPTQVREVWHFVRPVAGTDSWKLDGIQQVE